MRIGDRIEVEFQHMVADGYKPTSIVLGISEWLELHTVVVGASIGVSRIHPDRVEYLGLPITVVPVREYFGLGMDPSETTAAYCAMMRKEIRDVRCRQA